VVHVKWWFVKNVGQSLLMAWNCKIVIVWSRRYINNIEFYR
jgi:hypothetical protein